MTDDLRKAADALAEAVAGIEWIRSYIGPHRAIAPNLNDTLFKASCAAELIDKLDAYRAAAKAEDDKYEDEASAMNEYNAERNS